MHLARSTFDALFRERVGAAPLDHLLRRRMHHAATLLRGGDLSVHQVATALGYSSASAFSHAVKRVLGEPPTAFTRSRS